MSRDSLWECPESAKCDYTVVFKCKGETSKSKQSLTCLSPSLSRDSWSLRAVITWFLTVLLATCVALVSSSQPAKHWPVKRHCATVSCIERSPCRDWANLVPAVHRPLSVCGIYERHGLFPFVTTRKHYRRHTNLQVRQPATEAFVYLQLTFWNLTVNKLRFRSTLSHICILFRLSWTYTR